MERHRTRLGAELTRARLKRGCKDVEALRASLALSGAVVEKGGRGGVVDGHVVKGWPHPRWVRVNMLKTSLREQLGTTFVEYEILDSLEKVLDSASAGTGKVLHIDENVPNLLALPPRTDLSKTAGYSQGLIILQDKASCFPAYLLDPRSEDGDCLDGCAAPGNKTTHLAAILQGQDSIDQPPRVYACEWDKFGRSLTLAAMVKKAGADSVIINAGQDFLKIDPNLPPWIEIGCILLDPTCSGSGTIGDDESLQVILPARYTDTSSQGTSGKRKRKAEPKQTSPLQPTTEEEVPISVDQTREQLATRLATLAAIQLKMLLHAFTFPKARKITYSTCSIYAEENEQVVVKALFSAQAQRLRWRILRMDEQISGMKTWNLRGDREACRDMDIDPSGDVADIAEACIRCEKGTKEGTQGFFVAAFVRDLANSTNDAVPQDEDWEGFSDTESSG